MSRFVVAVLLLTSVSFAAAEQHATPIYQVSDAQGTFLQVPLTHDVYRYSQQANLQNVVVLDAEQNPLPSRLVAVNPPVPEAQAKVVTSALAFFPVAADATPDTLRKLHTTQVKVQGDKVQVATSDKTLSNKTPEFYLIDVSKLEQDMTSLIVEWDAQAANQYLEVELEATHNLQDWISLERATLVQINQQEQSLKHNHIKARIAKKDYEFLRLKVLRGADSLQITSISAEQKIDIANTAQKPLEAWSLVGERSKTQTGVYFPSSHSKTYPVTAWEYTRNEATPIETIAIDIGTSIYGDGIKIFSRVASNQNWQLQYQGIWFNAQVGAQWQKSDAVSLYRNSDKFWRLELSESAKNIANPQLVFAWQPTQLQIIANNKPPFVLAISSDNNNSYNREQVFNQIMSAAQPTWTAATLTQLNVSPEAIAGGQKVIDWKQWLFWLALVLAVVVLLVFSLKLFKQLNLSNAEQ